MLYLFLGYIRHHDSPIEYVQRIDGWFADCIADDWMTDGWAERVIREIDHSRLLEPQIVESPVYGTMITEWLSSGTKVLIMAKAVQNVVYNGDDCSDQCWPLLLELSKEVDIMASLTYLPRKFQWPHGAEMTIINTGQSVGSYDEFSRAYSQADPTKKWHFEDIEWPLEIDRKVFYVDFDF